MKNFWVDLKKAKKGEPILALAPLAGYTDSAFRLMCKKYGADVVYSEMASVSALYHGSNKTLSLLKFSKKENPYVVQLFGSNKDHFIKAVKMIDDKIKPDGFDINFGCPVKKVLKQGAGAKLMGDLKLSREIIMAVLSVTNKPVSIKIRAEAFSVDALDFLKNISDLSVAALMIHGRTLNQLFSGPINLNLIKKSKKVFSGIILANGGINDLNEAKKVVLKTGIDGVGFGRGALGQPWIFSEKFQSLNDKDKKKIAIKTAIIHLKLIKKNKGLNSLGEFKGHLAWYLKNFSGASNIRSKMMIINNYDEMEKMLNSLQHKK